MGIVNRMDRSVSPVVVRAREVLEPILERLGFSLAAEYIGPEAFGSAHSEYKSRSHRVELAWDGKDHWLWIKVAQVVVNGRMVPLQYQDLGRVLGWAPSRIHWIEPGPVAEERIQQLASGLTTFFDSDAAI